MKLTTAALNNKHRVWMSMAAVLYCSAAARAFSVAARRSSSYSRSSSSGSSMGTSAISATTTTSDVCAATPTPPNVNQNPLLQQEDLPKFASIQPSDLTPAISSLLAQLEQEFRSFEETLLQRGVSSSSSSSSITEDGNTEDGSSKSTCSNGVMVGTVPYDEVLPVVERMQFPLSFVWGVASHLNGVQNSDALRAAYEENQPAVVQTFSTLFSQSKPLYDALTAIEQSMRRQEEEEEETSSSTIAAADDDDDSSPTLEVLRRQKRRAVEASLRSMTLGGVGLEGAQKERFNDMKLRLASLSTTFSNNVLDETKAFRLTVTDPEKLTGVPESAKAMWAAAHVQFLTAQQQQQQQQSSSEEDDATEHTIPEMDASKGPWRISLDSPSYMAAMQHVADRELRETVYRASISRASEANSEKNNVPLIYEILSLKKEMAVMLGFANYAELSLASKMAPSIAAVTELSDLIHKTALPAAVKELEEITSMALAGGFTDSKLQPWDVTYWSERLKESKFELTEEETRPYFALPAVLDGMFSLVERIFNIKVVAADGDAEVWHKDVRFFKVYDVDTTKHIASFFLDPYSRPEDKRGGAWMDVCIGKSAAVNRDIPVAYLTCNGSPPVGDKPSLMTFREVETLFHEFGHGLQHMLTTASVGDVAGINGVEWDAVELPSQFMENWCYDRPTVYGFAKHWETGEPMPEEIFEKIKEQKTYNAGMMSCRQLQFGQLDIELHSNYDAAKGASGEGESIFDVQRRIAEKYAPFNMPLPEDRFLCTFSHIFAGGYAAGYYSYKWAEVMSADAFSAFEDVGLDNEEEVKKVGMKFRETVLSLGGGEDPMTVFKTFRGREPSPEALLRHNGLA